VLAPEIAAAHSYGAAYRLDETNSIAAGGEMGVSNTFASALWSIDTMFEFAGKGADGLNWHTGSGGAYGLFEFKMPPPGGGGTYSLRSVRPLYYGLLMFQQATGDGSRFLPARLQTSANLKAWATVSRKNVVHAVIINKDEQAAGAVTIAVPGFTRATIERLTAPNYQSTGGIRIGGQTFDGSVDGRPVGTPSLETVQASGANFVINMPTTSAALITFLP
jgi:hypothetical protein